MAWVESQGFEHWPSIIYDPRWTKGNINTSAMKYLGKKHVCLFYAMDASERFAYEPLSSIVPWEEGLRRGYDKNASHFKPKKYEKAFPKALAEAIEEHAKPKEQRSGVTFTLKQRRSLLLKRIVRKATTTTSLVKMIVMTTWRFYEPRSAAPQEGRWEHCTEEAADRRGQETRPRRAGRQSAKSAKRRKRGGGAGKEDEGRERLACPSGSSSAGGPRIK